MTERGLGGDNVDLDVRLDQFRRDRSARANAAKAMAQRWARQTKSTEKVVDSLPMSTGALLALAYPDRVARNRGNGSFILANGRGAIVHPTSSMAREPFIAVAELTGTAASSRVLLAAPLSQTDIEQRFASQIQSADELSVDRATLSLRARRRRRLGAIVFSEQSLPVVPSEVTAGVLADGIIAAGLDRLPWSKSSKQWRDRLMFLRASEPDSSWPDMSDTALAERKVEWLVPALFNKTALGQVSPDDLSEALSALLPWELRARLDPPRRRRISRRRPAPSSPSTMRAEEGPGKSRCGCRKCSGSTPIRRLQKAGCRWSWNCCRRRIGRFRSPAISPHSGAEVMRPCGPICGGAIPDTPGRMILRRRFRPGAPSPAEPEFKRSI